MDGLASDWTMYNMSSDEKRAGLSSATHDLMLKRKCFHRTSLNTRSSSSSLEHGSRKLCTIAGDPMNDGLGTLAQLYARRDALLG